MKTLRRKSELQGSLFEEDFLLRTLGRLTYVPDIALTELVANAWDAGAAKVSIQIPLNRGEELSVNDDGTGMSDAEFRRRWMTLGYDRVKHQGDRVTFPSERSVWHRGAYGRNGVGRHGLLCFGQQYTVETWQNGAGMRYNIATKSGKEPFAIESSSPIKRPGHGTRVSTMVERHLPDIDRIRNVLSARFLADPQFTVSVNGESIPLSNHTGLIETTALHVADRVRVEVYIVDSNKVGRTARQQGVAFWVGRRLVGEPSWVVGNRVLLDGRTRLARRFTVVVASDDLFNEVLPDWSAFKENQLTDHLFTVVSEHLNATFARLSADRVEESREAVTQQHAHEIALLPPLARLDVTEFIEGLTAAQPQATPESLSGAVRSLIELEKSRSGASLLEKIAKLSEADVEGLDRLLTDWTVRDALTVLNEIDRRIALLEMISRLSADPNVDELGTLHPLMTEARWLFGPEYDSPEFSANRSLNQAMLKLFGTRAKKNDFVNARRRPDIIVLEDATISATATESFDDKSKLVVLQHILVVELKKGAAMIDRENVHQASDYVEDLLRSGLLPGSPVVRAYVVGHEIHAKVERVRSIGQADLGRVVVATYEQLVATGRRRLFGLRERLSERYEQTAGVDLSHKSDSEGIQLTLLDHSHAVRREA